MGTGARNKVYQIAGTGIETPSAIEYFTDQRCIEKSILLFKCVRYEPKLGYRVEHVVDGDGTVVVPSALSLGEAENVENWWLDLKSYDNFINLFKKYIEIFLKLKSFKISFHQLLQVVLLVHIHILLLLRQIFLMKIDYYLDFTRHLICILFYMMEKW